MKGRLRRVELFLMILKKVTTIHLLFTGKYGGDFFKQT